MAEWQEQAFQWHEMYCHDLEVMSSNPNWVELGVRSTSVLSCTWAKNIVRLVWKTDYTFFFFFFFFNNNKTDYTFPKLFHSTKKPVTTMLTYPWKCTVLHCNHLGNTWKPLVLMTRHFDYHPRWRARVIIKVSGHQHQWRARVIIKVSGHQHQWFPGVSQVVTM